MDLRQKLETWLSRNVPDRAISQAFDLPAVVLTTDVGLQRSENQDRVAALSMEGTNGNRLLVAAVVDGMGGMREGAKCATLAMTNFLVTLATHHGPIQQKIHQAVSAANESVFKFAGGKGGATLSAVVLGGGGAAFVAHVGDSRVYSFGPNTRVERLTKDDSLAEAVGGHGRELLQFIGMGPEMQPFISEIPSGSKNLAITSDGIHFVETLTLQTVLANSPTVRSAAERLSALARWCGGPDNASSAFVDLSMLASASPAVPQDLLQVWDPNGSLCFSLESASPAAPRLSSQATLPTRDRIEDVDKTAGSPHAPSRGSRPAGNKGKNNNKGKKKESIAKEDIQLEIKIEGNSGEDTGDNRE